MAAKLAPGEAAARAAELWGMGQGVELSVRAALAYALDRHRGVEQFGSSLGS